MIRGFTLRQGLAVPALALAALLGGADLAAAQSAAAARPAPQFVTTSDSVRLAVIVAGSGPPVLYLHGGPGQASISFEQMGGSALESFATMHYLDQRGAGRSDSAADLSLGRMLGDIDEVRRWTGRERIYLLAHSFGGVLAVNYAARYPEHVAGLILVGATVHFWSDSLLAEQIAFMDSLLGREGAAGPAANRDTLLARHAERRRALNQQDIGYRLLTDTVATIQTMIALDRSYPRNPQFGASVMREPEARAEYYRNYAELTGSIAAPVLVLAGTRDRAIGPRHFRSFRFPNQRVVEIDGGHLFYYERNAEFVKAVREFLAAEAARPDP